MTKKKLSRWWVWAMQSGGFVVCDRSRGGRPRWASGLFDTAEEAEQVVVRLEAEYG